MTNTDIEGGDGLKNNMSLLIDVNLFPERFAERFEKIEVEQREIRNELKKIIEQQTKVESTMNSCLDLLTKLLPQIIAKIETVGSERSASSATTPVPVRMELTFQPIDTEAELVELNEKSKSSEFINKTIEYMGQTCGKDTFKDGRDTGYIVIDHFATRKFWTTCTWTGSSGPDNPKFCLSKYSAFIHLIEEVIRFSSPSWTKIQNQKFIIKSILGNSTARYTRNKQLKAPRSRAYRGKGKRGHGEDDEESDSNDSESLRNTFISL